MLAWQQGLAVSVRAPAKLFLGFRPAEADFSCFCAEIIRHECATAGQPAPIPAVMLWHSAGYDVGRPRGGHLFWASIYPHHNLPRRSASSITNMNDKRNLFKLLADRGPRNMASAARLDSRVKQTRPGRQPATASLALGCWNVRSLGPQTEATLSSPRKTALIDLELDPLGIQLPSLSETW